MTTTESADRWPSEELLGWTPRQREVLELIGCGKTNAEIAQSLSVGLAGAKWHVSEVLSKLGAVSREEAAEYWRERRRVSARLRRLCRGVVSLGSLKLGVAAAATAVACVATAGAVLVMTSGVDSPRPQVAIETTPAANGDGTAIFTVQEAHDRAVQLGSEYLHLMTDLPQTMLVKGKPISFSDLAEAEAMFVPARTTAALSDGNTVPAGESDVWAFVFRRDGVAIPEWGLADGFVRLNVIFEDGTGKIRAAAAGKFRPDGAAAKPGMAPPVASVDNERVGALYLVTAVKDGDFESTLHVYRTRGGTWCSLYVYVQGGGGTSCSLGPTAERPHIFGVGGNGAGKIGALATPPTLYGVVSASVSRLELVPESGDPVSVPLVPFPAESGLNWQGFYLLRTFAPEQAITLRAFDAQGTEIASMDLPRQRKLPENIVTPVDQIDFSGIGDRAGGEFRLPPPAFPVRIAVNARHEGSGPITVDLRCDTGTTRILDGVGNVGGADGSLIVDVPPDATRCSLDVKATGAWSLVSK